MKVRFKTEYQRSYRSRSVSPLRSTPLAGLRSDHMGVCREPCFQRRKKVNSHHSPQPCDSTNKSLHEPVIDSPLLKTPAETGEQSVMKSPKPDSKSPALLHPQSPTPNHALYRKAGLKVAGQRSNAHKTEYNRQFSTKMLTAAPSPTITAHETLFSNHSIVPPFKKHVAAMDTEYQRNFQGLAPPTIPRLRKNFEHERTPLFHTHVAKNKNVPKSKPGPRSPSPSPKLEVNKQQSSPKPVSADSAPSNLKKKHRLLTEYESRFRSPLKQIPEERDATRSHTSQIKELREQALSYRRRAWGTNFSRDHLSQLLSEHNALWEPTETTESEGPQSTRLDLCQVSSGGPGSSRSSCLEAVDLASISSRSRHKDSDVGSKDEDPDQTNKQNKTNPTTPQSSHSPAAEDILPSQEDDKPNVEEEGRLPTPKLKMLPVQRTHLDLTTPAAGGAVLVGKQLKGTDDEGLQRSGADSNAATPVHIPGKPREAWAADSSHKHNHKPSVTPRHSPPQAAARTPTAPLHCIQGTLRSADFQHNGQLGVRPSERNSAAVCFCLDEDDRLSEMSWRSAASCSRASAVLERAQRRRKNFWGES